MIARSASRFGRSAVLIPRLARTRVPEIAQEGIAKAVIESEQIVVLTDIGDVGNAADIEYDDRARPIAGLCGISAPVARAALRQPCRQPGNRTPPNPEPACQPRSVADLDRQAESGPMQHGPTMEPNDRDRCAAPEQAFDDLRLGLGEQLLGFEEDPGRALRSASPTASASACRNRTRSGREWGR